jgi:hypothetical protein
MLGFIISSLCESIFLNNPNVLKDLFNVAIDALPLPINQNDKNNIHHKNFNDDLLADFESINGDEDDDNNNNNDDDDDVDDEKGTDIKNKEKYSNGHGNGIHNNGKNDKKDNNNEDQCHIVDQNGSAPDAIDSSNASLSLLTQPYESESQPFTQSQPTQLTPSQGLHHTVVPLPEQSPPSLS